MDKVLQFGLALALAVPLAGPAVADARLAIPCPNGPRCLMEVTGHVDAVGGVRLPWTASVVAPADVCLYVYRVSSDGPVRVNIITPDGKRARLVKDMGAEVGSTIAGWYTIEVDSPAPVGEQIFKLAIIFDPASDCRGAPPPT